MNHKAKKLLLTAKPKIDESLLGFIVRMAEKNGYPRPRWILELAGIRTAASDYLCSLIFNEKTDLTSLAHVMGLEKYRLNQLGYPLTTNADSATPRRLIFDNPISHHAIRIFRTKICPHCLSEDSYCRRIWDLAPVTTCPVHKCLLLDKCPQCNKQIVAYRNSVSICSCKSDWRSAPTSPVTESELVVTRQVYKLCGLRTGGLVDSSLPISNPLLSLELDNFVTALFFIGGQYRGIVDTTGKYLAPSIHSSELHLLFNKAFSVFNNWPNQFYQFLDDIRGQENEMASITGIYRDFGKFYPGLYNHLKSSSFNFMRTAFEEYLITHWDGGYAFTMNRRKETKLGDRTRFIGRSEAAKQLRVKDNWINRFIDEGKLKAVVRQQRKKRMVLIEVESVENLKRNFDQSISLADIAIELGLRREVVVTLIKHGCLHPLRGPSVDGYGIWRFKDAAAGELLDKIRSKVAISFEPNKVNIAAAAKMLREDTGRLIRGVLDDKLLPCGESSKKGLLRFLFSSTQISDLMSARTKVRRGDLVNVKQATKALKLNRQVVSWLVDKGILQAEIKHEQGCPVRLLSKNVIERFESTYVSLTEAAKSLGITYLYLAKLLDQKGIEPAFGFKIGPAHQYIFKKADLELIDLVSITPQKINGRRYRWPTYDLRTSSA